MALSRKYWGFNLYSAVPVPTQSSAVLVPMVGLEPTHLFKYQILSLGCLPIPSHGHIGGDGGTRTHTSAQTPDFESGTSTDSITSPYVQILIRVLQTLIQKRILGSAAPSAASRASFLSVEMIVSNTLYFSTPLGPFDSPCGQPARAFLA